MLIHALLRRKSDGARGFVNIRTSHSRSCDGRIIIFNDACTIFKHWPKPSDEPLYVSGLRFSDDYRTMIHPAYESIIVVPCVLQDNIIYQCWVEHGRCDEQRLVELFEAFWQRVSRTRDERVEMTSFDKLYLCDVRIQDTCDTVYVVGCRRWIFAPRLVFFLGLDSHDNVYRGRVVLKGPLQREETDDERVTFPDMYVDDMHVPGSVTVRRIDACEYVLEHTHFLQFAKIEFASVPFQDESDFNTVLDQCRAREKTQRDAASAEQICRVNDLSRSKTRAHDAVFRGICG